MREGSPFEGTSGASPYNTPGSYYALDVTQPDELVVDAGGIMGHPGPGNFTAPKCLNASGDASCGKDAPDAAVRAGQPARAWPTVLWEITTRATGRRDVTGSRIPRHGGDLVQARDGPHESLQGQLRQHSAPRPVIEDHYVAIFGGGFDRERLNRRGNWLYIVDVETGRALYARQIRAAASTPAPVVALRSISDRYPSEPAALDFNGDGYLDVIYSGT